jgi:hypothetical protein
MKALYSLVALLFSVLLSACATYQSAGQIEAGRQALFVGQNQTA